MAKKVGFIASDAKLAQIAVRLPQKVLNKISAAAGKEKISVSAKMRGILTEAVAPQPQL